jgi:hypothetical protein
MAWFVEALQPADGLAFISQESAEGVERQFFFIGPPYHQPLPVRDFSTALWATRGTFQEGLFLRGKPVDPGQRGGMDTHLPSGNHELLFQTIEQIIEFVRRLFIAYGFDMGDPSGAPALRPHTPPLLPAPKGMAQAIHAQIKKTLGKGKDARLELEKLFNELCSDAGYLEGLRLLAIDCLSRTHAGELKRRADAETGSILILLLEKTGLWEGIPYILKQWAGLMNEGKLSHTAAIPNWQSGRLNGAGIALQPHILRGFLFNIPASIPLAAPHKRGLYMLAGT